MLMDKRIKKTITASIFLITLLEIYFAYKIVVDYAGIYQVEILIPLLLQPFLYHSLFRKEKTYFKTRITLIGLISVSLPLLIYFTLPNYTYDKGKQIVKQYLDKEKDYIFVDLSHDKDTIPVINNMKKLLVSNRVYYYEVTSKNGKKYLIINPLTGQLQELEKSYW